jgi:predicted transcriptional regulator
MDLLLTLIKYNDKQMTLEDLSKAVNRDKSTVFRSLQKLTGLGICVKESRTLKEGGHFHVYSSISRDIFKLETEKRVKELEQSLRRILKKFEDDLDIMLDDVYKKK